MSNGEVCCILGICCPPIQRRQTFIDHLVTETGCPAEHAGKIVDWLDERFAFAPKSMEEAIQDIARMARRPSAT